MKKLVLVSLVVLGIVLLFSPKGFAVDPPDEKERARTIFALEEIKANPESFKSTPIIFQAQFHKFNDLYSPFYTIFNSASHLNFAVWSYEAPLWEKEVYKRDFPYLYVDKKNKRLSEKLMKIKTYTRIQLTGEIRSTFNDIPWIQVEDVKVIPDQLSLESIKHMARGFHLRNKGDELNASLEFTQAWADTLPLWVKQVVKKEEGKSLFAVGKYEDAIDALEAAIDYADDGLTKDEEAEYLLKESEAMLEYEERLADQMEEWEEEAEEAWDDEQEALEEWEVEDYEEAYEEDYDGSSDEEGYEIKWEDTEKVETTNTWENTRRAETTNTWENTRKPETTTNTWENTRNTETTNEWEDWDDGVETEEVEVPDEVVTPPEVDWEDMPEFEDETETTEEPN
jgi:tetratricopeptide (TPR) repeat protein